MGGTSRRKAVWLGALAGLCFCLRAAAQTATAGGSEFSVQLWDGLGRALPGVTVEVFRMLKGTNGQAEKIELAKAFTGADGIARGLYDKSSIPTNETFSVALSKDGYAGYTAGPQVNYTLKRLFKAADLARILKLPTDGQRTEMRELLAGTMDPAGPPLNELMFKQQAETRPILKWLLDDQQIGAQAGELLAFIGDASDVRLLMQYAPEPNGDPAIDRWTYAVASTLLQPSSEREWSFLKQCAADNYGDHWVDTAAIRTLRLMASTRSRQTLEDVRLLNPYRTNEIASALKYIDSRPGPLTATNAAMAAEKVAQALDVGLWMGNEQPRYDEQQRAALVDCNFLAGGTQFLVFTATLGKDGNRWNLRGVRQTRQSLLPKAPGKAQASK